ncbi:MAG: OprO/OprP family phosphate-selective porin, partial [Sphingorhabdus sp.]
MRMDFGKKPLLSGIALMAMLVANPALAQSNDAELEALRAEIAALKAQLAEISAKVDKAASPAAPVPAIVVEKKTETKPVPEIAFKGAPEIKGEGGWSFKPRGRIHFDVGNIAIPGEYAASRNLGFNSRFRRVRLGAEGTMPGGFGYKVEVDFANANTSFGDAYLSYSPENAPITLRLGNFDTLSGLEQPSSSNYVTYLERAAFNDAFLNSRRLGAALAWRSTDKALLAEAGLFVAHSIDSSFDNNGWIGAGRLVYAPKALGGQLHFGLNYQHRNFASNAGGVASNGVNTPSTNQLARYRARPNTQLTDVRFVDTGSFAAKGDRIIGAEIAGVFNSLYFAGEAQWLKADAYRAGDLATGLDAFTGGNIAVVPTSDPEYFGAYGEVGYFITGETRGYRQGEGAWSRTKVLNPVNKGGLGAFQIATRLDHIDLDDSALKNGLTNNFTTGATSLAAINSRLGRGGKQTSYLLGLNWYPIDYIRFMLNYGRVEIDGGPIAVLVDP